MLELLLSIRAPLASLVLFNLGAAFLVTLLSVKLKQWGVPAWEQGLSGGMYYVGYAAGAFWPARLIRRVGHIRAYATLAPLLGVVALLHGLLPEAWVWHLLRLFGGYCTAGVLLCIESWLLLVSDRHTRGRTLALYTIGLYLAQGSGQFLRSLHLDFNNSMMAFGIIAIFSSLSVMPIAAARIGASQLSEPDILSVKELVKLSPLGVTGCFLAGLMLGVLYTLLPVSILELGYAEQYAYWGVGVLILGGGLLQYPLGRLSDLVNRRRVILAVAAFTGFIALVLTLPVHDNAFAFFGLLFALGGTGFAIYPLSLTYACDFVSENNSLSAASGLFLFYSFGAIVGPYLAPITTRWMGPTGNFLFVGCAAVTLVALGLYRTAVRAPMPTQDQQEFVPSPSSTPAAYEMNPSLEENTEEEKVHH